MSYSRLAQNVELNNGFIEESLKNSLCARELLLQVVRAQEWSRCCCCCVIKRWQHQRLVAGIRCKHATDCAREQLPEEQQEGAHRSGEHDEAEIASHDVAVFPGRGSRCEGLLLNVSHEAGLRHPRRPVPPQL